MVTYTSLRHFLILPLVIMAALALPLSGSAQSTAQPDKLQFETPAALRELVEEGLQNNQDLVALQRQISARRLEIRAAGAWDDPVVGLGLLNLPVNTFDFDQEPMTQKQVSISQRIAWFGKLDLKTRRAALDAMRLATTLAAKKLELVRELAQAWYQLGFTIESQGINAAMINKVEQIIRIAESNYATGTGLQQDVLQAQVEQSRLMDTRIMLENERRTLEDRIQALLNRESFRAPAPPTVSALPPPAIESEPWNTVALANNPDLIGRRIEAEMAEVDADLAGKAYWPDPNFQVAYGQRGEDPMGNDRDDFVSASISFSLPLWARSKQKPRLEAARQMQQAARARIEAIATRLPHEIDAVLSGLRQLRANRDLFRSAITVQAEQWAQAAMAAYRVGNLDFNAMISAHLRQLELERQSSRYLYQYYQKLAELNQIIGGGLISGQATNHRLSVQQQRSSNK